jgi:hypothetical protein
MKFVKRPMLTHGPRCMSLSAKNLAPRMTIGDPYLSTPPSEQRRFSVKREYGALHLIRERR